MGYSTLSGLALSLLHAASHGAAPPGLPNTLMPLVATGSGDGIGLYDRWRCGERYIPGKELEFDRFPDSELKTPSFRSSAIACSMARFLDRNDLSDAQKFDRLVRQAGRSGKWGATMFEWMARLDWDRFDRYLQSRNGKFQPEELIELTGEWDNWLGARKSPFTKQLRNLLVEHALHHPEERVRAYAMGYIEQHDISPEEALSFYARLPFESNRNIRETIIDALAHFNLPATNKLLRDFLKGPLEPKLLPQVCSEELVKYGRYDLLPDLYALRQRLASEKDVRKQQEAREILESVDKGIKALEELKRRKAPIAGATPTAGASP